MNQEQAEERIGQLKDYYSHLASYVAVNLFLFALNMLNNPDNIWFVYPLFGWGIGMAIHTAEVFWTGSDWEERKREELTGLRATQDEMQRLSERTDALVTILSNVNWEKIDPELLETREMLEAAKATLGQLKSQDDPGGQRQVTAQIEKLEKFVTSPKFGYYELAANERDGA